MGGTSFYHFPIRRSEVSVGLLQERLGMSLEQQVVPETHMAPLPGGSLLPLRVRVAVEARILETSAATALAGNERLAGRCEIVEETMQAKQPIRLFRCHPPGR